MPSNPPTDISNGINFITTHTNFKVKKFGAGNYVLYQPLSLEQHHENLSEILVFGYLNQGFSKLNDGSFLIDLKGEKLLPGTTEPNALQAVQNLPGIQSIDETISNINIRGGSNDQNLILYNGLRVYQTGHLFGLISAFNPYPPHKIKVTKHLNNSKHTGSTSGIIALDYSMKDTTESEFGAGLDLLSSHAYGNWRINDKVSTQFSIRSSITDLIETPSYTAFKNRVTQASELESDGAVDFNFTDATLGIDITLTKNSNLKLFGVLFQNNLNYRASINPSHTTKLNQNHLSLGYTYSTRINNNFILENSGYYTEYTLNSSLKNAQTNNNFNQNNTIKDFGTSISATLHLSENSHINAGLEANQISVSDTETIITPNIASVKTTTVNSYDAYIQSMSNSKNKKLYISSGLRFNFRPFYNKVFFEPRLQARYKINNTYQISTTLQQANQHMFQVFDEAADFQGVEKRRWRLSDSNTNPVAQSQQVSFEIQRHHNGFLLGVEAYYKHIDNIVSGSQNFSGVFSSKNAIGRTSSLGLEVLVHKKTKRLNTWLSYHFNDSYSEFEGLNNGQRFANAFEIQHTLNLGATLTFNTFTLGTVLNYNSGVNFTPATNENSTVVSNDFITYRSINSETLPYYFRTDISVQKTFLIKNTKLISAVSLWNIFNRKNSLNTYYQINSDNVVVPIVQQSLGTVFNVSTRLVW